jgi:hypothetical protein
MELLVDGIKVETMGEGKAKKASVLINTVFIFIIGIADPPECSWGY